MSDDQHHQFMTPAGWKVVDLVGAWQEPDGSVGDGGQFIVGLLVRMFEGDTDDERAKFVLTPDMADQLAVQLAKGAKNARQMQRHARHRPPARGLG